MKRPTVELFKRQRHRSEKVMLQKNRWTHAKRLRRAARVRAAIPHRVKNLRIEAPAEIRFHGTETVRRVFWKFIHEIRDALHQGSSVKLDLRPVKVLHPCGLLILLNQVRTWATTFPNRLTASYPDDEVVEQMLQVVGILKKLGLEERQQVTREEVTRWYYFHGEDVDASRMTPFMDAVSDMLGEVEQSMLYDCVVEAITNVRHHAYEGDARTRWWMFASIIESHLTVAIHDGGRSIPVTLMEKPGVRQQVKQWIWGRKKVDVMLLKAAMGGLSRTKLAYRGKGLPEMLESTRKMPGSSLSIYSRKGVFATFLDSVPDACELLSHTVEGTLVLWSLKIPDRQTS